MMARTEDGIRVDVTGLVGAYERRWRRWRGACQWGFVVAALLIATASWWWGVAATKEQRRLMGILTFDLALAQARAGCWQALAVHQPGYGPAVPLEERPAAVGKCVERELSRWVLTTNGGRR